MNQTLFDTISRIARHEVYAQATAAVALVEAVFIEEQPPAYVVNLSLRDTVQVLPRVPVTVGLPGLGGIPQVGDLVIVLFLQGDRHAPVVIGRLYHIDRNAPAHKPGDIALALPAGNSEPTLQLNLSGEPASLKINLPGEVDIQFTEGKVTIKVGALVAELDGGAGRVALAAGSSKISMDEDGDIALAAAGNLKLEGTDIQIKGSGKVTVNGVNVEVN